MESSSLGPAATGRYSVARVVDCWYVVCRSAELGRRPIARTVLGTPMALFRGAEGRAAALLDRCAHRNLPLSRGRVVDGRIECAYHGWQYDGGGICRLVPALSEPSEGPARCVRTFPTAEQQGYVWVWFGADGSARGGPFSFPHVDDPRYASARFEFEVEATVYATLENMLDVPHTAFLHRGLFRGGRRSEVIAVVRRWSDRVEAEYVGEPRPSGLIARVLAPGTDAAVSHVDRFILPSIAQVEYAIGDRSHLLVTNVLTPVDDFVTRFYSVVSFRLPLPAALVRLIVTPIARRIFRQDAAILRLQTDAVRRFGGEQYASTDVDLLGPHMWRLLRQAEQGSVPAAGEEPEVEKRVRLLV